VSLDQVDHAGLTIAQTAARTGLTAHTLRYYERDGLMQHVDRSATGHRRYTEQDLDWITMITRLRRTGMPIRDIRRYAALVRAGEGTEPERMLLLQQHRDRVRAELDQTAAHLAMIDRKIDFYAGRLSACDADHDTSCDAPAPDRGRARTDRTTS